MHTTCTPHAPLTHTRFLSDSHMRARFTILLISATTAQAPYVAAVCVQQLEDTLHWFSSRGIWAIITLRGENAASNMFKDKVLAVGDHM